MKKYLKYYGANSLKEEFSPANPPHFAPLRQAHIHYYYANSIKCKLVSLYLNAGEVSLEFISA